MILKSYGRGYMKNYKKRWGDRPDARLIRDIDGMHLVMPLIYPNRADNEAFISERFDLTKTVEYLAKKNAENPEFAYKIFQVIVAAVMKTVVLRPRFNYFYSNKNLYERDDISCGFVVKKEFKDGAKEGLTFIKVDEDSTFESLRSKLYKEIHRIRVDEAEDFDKRDGKKAESTDDFMDWFTKIPRFVTKFLFCIIRFLDKHGWIPKALIAEDPDYASVFFTNLGSIKLKAGYHHLANWGTTSLFVIIGEMKKRPYFNDDGTFDMRMSVDLGFTIDERIADGYYYSKSIRIIKKLIENPELLEEPFGTKVEVE